MPDHQELPPLPCPFCGSSDITDESGQSYRWRLAVCADCGAKSGEVRTLVTGSGENKQALADARRDAFDEWNRRAEAGKRSAPAVSGEAVAPEIGEEAIVRFNRWWDTRYGSIDKFCRHAARKEAWEAWQIAAAHPTGEVEKNAARYRWLCERFLGADFDWGFDEGHGTPVLLIQAPADIQVYGDLTLTIDAAMNTEAKNG